MPATAADADVFELDPDRLAFSVGDLGQRALVLLASRLVTALAASDAHGAARRHRDLVASAWAKDSADGGQPARLRAAILHAALELRDTR